MQQQGVGPLQVHGIPGTPVGDLFPPGNAVFGDGNRSSLRPIRAGELRSHSASWFFFNRVFVSTTGFFEARKISPNDFLSVAVV